MLAEQSTPCHFCHTGIMCLADIGSFPHFAIPLFNLGPDQMSDGLKAEITVAVWSSLWSVKFIRSHFEHTLTKFVIIRVHLITLCIVWTLLGGTLCVAATPKKLKNCRYAIKFKKLPRRDKSLIIICHRRPALITSPLLVWPLLAIGLFDVTLSPLIHWFCKESTHCTRDAYIDFQ